MWRSREALGADRLCAIALSGSAPNPPNTFSIGPVKRQVEDCLVIVTGQCGSERTLVLAELMA